MAPTFMVTLRTLNFRFRLCISAVQTFRVWRYFYKIFWTIQQSLGPGPASPKEMSLSLPIDMFIYIYIDR